ncbi:MAG: GNAT family N-acetyltransferase [Anaerolineaceae bacterium]|jgi:ribosomal protein S18 acetylase RimI-like enzyme|nr:GNAT family N-acetyltransferase [Anaerolineaceae bacterium]
MTELQCRWMEPDEVNRVGEIDRSEIVRSGYVYEDGMLKKMDVQWDSSAWLDEGEGEHTVAAQIKFCRDHLLRGGCMYGVFDVDRLVGVGILQPEIRKGIAQLACLHVSNGYRQKGIASCITEALIYEAKRGGARQMYVSATPSGSAVGFYRSQGFEPVERPLPELFELEPEDIHMLKELG